MLRYELDFPAAFPAPAAGPPPSPAIDPDAPPFPEPAGPPAPPHRWARPG